MPRKGPVAKKVMEADPVYGSPLVTRIVNTIMKDGKKVAAMKIFYGAMTAVEAKTGKPAMEVLDAAYKNVMPLVEVKARRVGGANYQVPIEVKPERGQAIATRWLVTNANKRGGKSMLDKFAAEIMDASNSVGASVKKREDLHKMAEANKAFAHYRF